MLNIKIPGFILKLLRRNRGKPVATKMGGTVCDHCRILIGPSSDTEYYNIASGEYCSLGCYTSSLLGKVSQNEIKYTKKQYKKAAKKAAKRKR